MVPTIVTQIIAGLTQSIRALLQFRAVGRSEIRWGWREASWIPGHLEGQGFAYIFLPKSAHRPLGSDGPAIAAS